MYKIRNATNRVSSKGITAIKNGVVWAGTLNSNGKQPVIIKKCGEHEIDTQDTLHKEFPRYVPKVFNRVKCFDGTYMYTEFIPGGTLKKYTGKSIVRLALRSIRILKEMYTKHPNFRHNDLHIDNIMIKNDEPIIYDFELSNFNGNPLFTEDLKVRYGIYPGNNKMYDVHFLLNSLCSEPRFSKVIRDKVGHLFPDGYLVAKSKYVNEWRLKYNVQHKLPTIDQVIEALSHSSKLLEFTGPRKFTKVNRSPPKRSAFAVAFNAYNRNRVAGLKTILMRSGTNEVQAGIQATKIIERIKLIKSQILARRKNSPSNKEVANLMNSGTNKVQAAKAQQPPAPITRIAKLIAIANASTPSPKPVVTFDGTRPRLNNKFADGYKKDELIRLVKKLGYRVLPSMTIKQICALIKRSNSPVTRPSIAGPSVTRPRNTLTNLNNILNKSNITKITKGHIKQQLRALGHSNSINNQVIKNRFIKKYAVHETLKLSKLLKANLKNYVVSKGVKILSRNTKKNMLNMYIKGLYIK
jgi:hypothetical protein